MGIRYENLDEITRRFMLDEVAMGGHYISPRLTVDGQAAWPALVSEAAGRHDDDWISAQLVTRGYLRAEEQYTREGVTRSRRINQQHAAQQLAEGEFNRYYLRGLCLRAAAIQVDHLVIYRGKEVTRPRPESEARIGTRVLIAELLPALRQNDFVSIEDAIGVPGGPSSGLTCRLP